MGKKDEAHKIALESTRTWHGRDICMHVVACRLDDSRLFGSTTQNIDCSGVWLVTSGMT